MTVASDVESVEQIGMSNGRPKLIKSPELRRVVDRSCRNCGWKLTKKPTVVELYGVRRVDHKTMVRKHKWCVVRSERPSEGCCSEWTPKQNK